MLEEVENLGYPNIGPASLQRHSLSNFEGLRPPVWGRDPLTEAGSVGWLALLVEIHFSLALPGSALC